MTLWEWYLRCRKSFPVSRSVYLKEDTKSNRVITLLRVILSWNVKIAYYSLLDRIFFLSLIKITSAVTPLLEISIDGFENFAPTPFFSTITDNYVSMAYISAPACTFEELPLKVWFIIETETEMEKLLKFLAILEERAFIPNSLW